MTNYLELDAELIRKCLPGGADVPEGSDSLFLIYAVLLRSKGADVDASDVHDAWAAWMVGVDPDHDSILPFENLDKATRREDSPFLVAIREAAARR
ncbi:DUF7701 domain-containing protein [Brevibacterium epidermidis]|uniref:DUF7701 domain-containing protein n=1 Tax=Brevibacterium epidermidis TaxID=1698 RepID=UPI000BF84DE0|nr:hypothetical protein [Brevibacterium epidermidis]